MRRAKQLSIFFFIIGFCSCLFLIGLVRIVSSGNLDSIKNQTVGLISVFKKNKKNIFFKPADCSDCKKISRHIWHLQSLKVKNDLHIASAKKYGIEPFESNAQLEKKVPSLLVWGKLKELKDGNLYRLKNLTHSYPYLVPSSSRLLDEIAERFQAKLKELDIEPYLLLVSSVLRTNESQNGLGKKNANAARSESSHFYGTTFDISYKEFLPRHGQYAPEGYCRHDMMRYPLAEVLSEMSDEGKCLVVKEVKQACYHVTLNHK